MKFVTATGSVYELDYGAKKIRRLSARAVTTVRIAEEWRSYADIIPDPIVVGVAVVLIWGKDVPLLPETELPEGAIPFPITHTSPVVAILHDPACPLFDDDDWNGHTAINYRNAFGQEPPCTCDPKRC